MEDFWASALWALKIWLYIMISLIMFPAMFGFSLGISETYMNILVKTLEVLYCYVPCKCALSCADALILIHWSMNVPPLVCPPLQWATLKIQKVFADEQTLNASASNGE